MRLLLLMLPFLSTLAAYGDLDDNILKKLTENKEAFRLYIGCFVDFNTCDNIGSHAKAHIAQALVDGCNECDDDQKQITHAVIKKMKTEYPEIYEAFENRYDPDRTLLSTLDENLKAYWQ